MDNLIQFIALLFAILVFCFIIYHFLKEKADERERLFEKSVEQSIEIMSRQVKGSFDEVKQDISDISANIKHDASFSEDIQKIMDYNPSPLKRNEIKRRGNN